MCGPPAGGEKGMQAGNSLKAHARQVVHGTPLAESTVVLVTQAPCCLPTHCRATPVFPFLKVTGETKLLIWHSSASPLCCHCLMFMLLPACVIVPPAYAIQGICPQLAKEGTAGADSE